MKALTIFYILFGLAIVANALMDVFTWVLEEYQKRLESVREDPIDIHYVGPGGVPEETGKCKRGSDRYSLRGSWRSTRRDWKV